MAVGLGAKIAARVGSLGRDHAKLELQLKKFKDLVASTFGKVEEVDPTGVPKAPKPTKQAKQEEAGQLRLTFGDVPEAPGVPSGQRLTFGDDVKPRDVTEPYVPDPNRSKVPLRLTFEGPPQGPLQGPLSAPTAADYARNRLLPFPPEDWNRLLPNAGLHKLRTPAGTEGLGQGRRTGLYSKTQEDLIKAAEQKLLRREAKIPGERQGSFKVEQVAPSGRGYLERKGESGGFSSQIEDVFPEDAGTPTHGLKGGSPLRYQHRVDRAVGPRAFGARQKPVILREGDVAGRAADGTPIIHKAGTDAEGMAKLPVATKVGLRGKVEGTDIRSPIDMESPSPTKPPTRRDPEASIPDEDYQHALSAGIDNLKQTKGFGSTPIQQLEARALLALLHGTGLRGTAGVKAFIDAWDPRGAGTGIKEWGVNRETGEVLPGGMQLIIPGSGKTVKTSEVLVRVPEGDAEILREYFRKKIPEGGKLFPEFGKSVGANSSWHNKLHRLVSRAFKGTKSESISPQNFRHNYAALVMRPTEFGGLGLNLEDAQAMLGHSNIQETINYLFKGLRDFTVKFDAQKPGVRQALQQELRDDPTLLAFPRNWITFDPTKGVTSPRLFGNRALAAKGPGQRVKGFAEVIPTGRTGLAKWGEEQLYPSATDIMIGDRAAGEYISDQVFGARLLPIGSGGSNIDALDSALQNVVTALHKPGFLKAEGKLGAKNPLVDPTDTQILKQTARLVFNPKHETAASFLKDAHDVEKQEFSQRLAMSIMQHEKNIGSDAATTIPTVINTLREADVLQDVAVIFMARERQIKLLSKITEMYGDVIKTGNYPALKVIMEKIPAHPLIGPEQQKRQIEGAARLTEGLGRNPFFHAEGGKKVNILEDLIDAAAIGDVPKINSLKAALKRKRDSTGNEPFRKVIAQLLLVAGLSELVPKTPQTEGAM